MKGGVFFKGEVAVLAIDYKVVFRVFCFYIYSVPVGKFGHCGSRKSGVTNKTCSTSKGFLIG